MLLDPEQTRNLCEDALRHGYAILAVNADSPAAVADCLLAAKDRDAPIMVETSLWQLTGQSFGIGDPLLGVDRYLADLRTLADSERFQSVPVVYHTDHIRGENTLPILKHAIRSGASSISLDSSLLSAEENVAMMRALCAFAAEHSLAATLEMEAGVDDGVTTLEEARSLFGAVEETHPGYLALWAPGVGTQHGLGSDPNAFRPEAVAQHRACVSDLAGRPVGLALHGSSGLAPSQLGEAVKAGVVKVNWSSESLLIRSQAARDYYRTQGDCLSKGHPEFKNTAMDHGVQSFVSSRFLPKVSERIEHLGGAGQGNRFLNMLSHD